MTTDILDPSATLSLLSTLLPVTNKALVSQHDALAALVHSIMSIVAFRLVAVDEASPTSQIVNNVLPESWNKDGPGHYTFKYTHNQSSLEFVVKVSKLGSRTLINAIAAESNNIASLDVCTNDFTSPSFFSVGQGSDGDGPPPPLVHGFISSNRVADFTSQVKLKVLQKLIPGLRKEGYSEVADMNINAGPSRPPPPRNSPPARPQPESPSFEPLYHIPPRNPLTVGRSDLDPIPHHPFVTPPIFPGVGGDGMFVGPDHPIFDSRRGRNGVRGPWGGDGYLPPMGAPPGARFDPIVPGSGHQGSRRFPSGELDNDEFMPPGMGDMFM